MIMILKQRRTVLKRTWTGFEAFFGKTLSVAAFIGMTAVDSHAYLDGGAGSYLIQIVLAGVFTLTFFFGRIRERIGKAYRLFVSRGKSNKDTEGRSE